MKKFASILLALTMVLSLCIPAFAAEQQSTYTLTITGATGHTYKIYQIFTGDIAEIGDKTVLTNVKYGKNFYPVDGGVGTPVPNTELHDINNATDPIQLFKTVSNPESPFEGSVSPDENGRIVIENIPGGYYMIVDTSENLQGTGEVRSQIMLQVLGDVTITSKHATISSEKKVKDKNDTTGETSVSDWQDSADYDIGDDVPFRLSVTLPSTMKYYGGASGYELTFHDKQAAGFGSPENISVYIERKNGTTIPVNEKSGENAGAGYRFIPQCAKRDTCEFNGCSFSVTVSDIYKFYSSNATEFVEGDKLVIEYTAELKNAATVNQEGTVVGKEGNVNSMYVCHPDGHTPQDDVIVFTYELKVNKIDGDSQTALPGAGFTLYKWDGTDWAKVGDEIKGRDDTGNEITSFTWSGIDDGKYKLVETTTPAGYNTIADREFVVTADHKAVWVAGGNSAFEDLIAKDAAGNIVFADADVNMNEDGKLEGDVENFKGVVLPETGAKGTIILLTVSALLVMIAAVFMITRKKMSIYAD